MDLVKKIIEEATKQQEESATVLESVENVQEESDRNEPKIDAEKCELETEGEKYDNLELRNRTVTETLSLVSDFGQDSQKAEEAHEEDEMRELLDHVSTTATRASSIAGSIFGENRAGSVSGSVFGDALPGHGLTFSFSEPGHLDQSEDQETEEQSRLNFNFSMPLDSSQIENDEKITSKAIGKSKLAAEPSEEVFDKLELRNRTVTE